ncbi:leucine Rich repeat-containing domain protein [Ostertagia ostertagi]
MIRLLALIPLLFYTSRADICSYCSCDRHTKSVTCNSPTLLIRTVSLLPWIEQVHLIGLNLPHPPHFLFHPALRVLRINRCGLQSLSAHSLLPLPNLEVLDLAENHLDTLPATILRSLKRLRVVNLSRNRLSNLSQFSPVLAENVVLEQLDLSGNPLALSTSTVSLPPSEQLLLSAANLAFINSSAIVFHPSTTCPMDVGCRILAFSAADFGRLNAFDVSNNRLRIDNSALTALTNASHLDFSYTHLPPGFVNWLVDESRTKSLNLSHAELHLNDESWSSCGHELKTLDITGLRLKRLHLLKNCVLTTVFARDNLLETSWLEAVSLEALHLDRNLFTDWPILPPGVALDRLRSLTLSSNLLTSLPPHALSQFPNLQHLDVSRNQISEIDHLAFPTLGMQLVSIDLSFNQLSILPHPVLPSLIYLDVSSNNLVTMDSALFAGLPLLQHLKLANNPQIFTRCEERCWSDHLDELTGLTDLDLSYCDLSRALHLSHLQSLRTLLLRGNQIVNMNADDLPPNLSTLDLGENRLHFTRNFSRLRSLRDLRVDTNPLRCDCSLHDIVPHLLNQTQITDPQLYYCFSGSWQYPLLPYLTGVTPCRNSTAQFIPVLVSTFAFSIIIICLLLLGVIGYKRYGPLMSHTYQRLATDFPTRL